MTVSELIKALQAMPQDMRVVVWDDGPVDYRDVNEPEVQPAGFRLDSPAVEI